jgi:GNAT superfamily N-acetyltransferase
MTLPPITSTTTNTSTARNSRLVREATAADITTLADVMARAFQDDPVHRWLLPGDAEYDRHSRSFWTVILQHALRKGTALTTSQLEGAALWLPPHPTHKPAIGGLLFMARMLFILRGRSLRGLRAANAIEAVHFTQPHWYLAVLGTAPEHRGKGVSAAVMSPILRQCDAAGIPAYLESSNAVNLPLYERRGFRVTRKLVLPGGGPPIWPMLRQPAVT